MVNLGIWNSIFVVPSCIVDKYIKLATSLQIKVLLWILRNPGTDFSFDDIKKILCVHESDIKDAFQYWINEGVVSLQGGQVGLPQNTFEGDIVSNEVNTVSNEVNIVSNEVNTVSNEGDTVSNEGNTVSNEGNTVSNESETVNKERKIEVKTRSISRCPRPSSDYIAERMISCPEIAFLMQESQVILGRPISGGDSGILLMLHDHDGLPIDVIIMLLQYTMDIKKANMKYIERVGISWAEQGINTLEKAENHIQMLDESNKAWRRFINIMGIEYRAPSDKEQEAVNNWINMWGYGDDMIKEAYDRCINYNGKCVLKYIDSIIKRWKEQEIFTIDKATEEADIRNKSKCEENNKKPSYNIEEYEKYSIFDEIG